MVQKTLLTLLSVSLIPFSVSARGLGFEDEPKTTGPTRPYSFSGPCTSQGSWTQAALSQTGRIREIVLQIKNDPNCSALSKNLSGALGRIEENLRSVEGDGTSGARLRQLPQEIAGLRQFATGDNEFRSKVMDSLFGRTIEQATLAARSENMSRVDGASYTSTAEALMGLTDRARRAANTSLDLFNEMLGAAPQLEQCLVQPDGMAQYFAASVKVLSSFASSGQDGTGIRLARAVSRLSNIMGREAKFADMIRQLNEQDFLVSMTCLMEVTSESYCSARDGQMLFDKIMKEKVVTPRGDARSAQNPLYGYYILNEHLPVVNRWLQQVQIGVASRRPEDASAKIKVINEVQIFFNAVERLRATMAFDSDRINGENDIDQQRASLLRLIEKVIAEMRGVQPMGESPSDRENFFTAAGTPTELAFMLIGIPVPEEFQGADVARSPESWIEANYTRIPGFRSPKTFLISIQKNFDAIVEKAQLAAQTFYQRYFVADQVSVVNKALLGSHLNVKKALGGIDSYLAELDRKMARAGDPSMIGSIRETRRRIRDILVAFDEVRAFSEKVAASPRMGEENYDERVAIEQDAELVRVTSKLLQTVYSRLDLLAARTTFLSSRLSDMVTKDYEIMLNSGANFTPYYQELYQATGQALVENMVRLGGGNPANVQSDLAQALRINKTNIEVLEKLLKNPFTAQTAFIKLIAENRQPGAWDLYWDSNLRSFKERAVNLPGEDSSATWRFLRGFFGGVWSSAVNSDRYPYQNVTTFFRFGNDGFRHSPDDEFGSAKKLHAQLCTQSLAFNDLRPLWPICKGVELKTPYVVSTDLKINEEPAMDYLSVVFEKKMLESKKNPSLNHSKRICAFRDYNRRNLVMYLTEKNR